MNWWQWTLAVLGTLGVIKLAAFLWQVHDYCDNGN